MVPEDSITTSEPSLYGTCASLITFKMPGYKPYKGIVDATIRISKEEGIKTLYSGLLPSLLLTSHAAIQFVIYEKLKQIETQYQIAIVSILMEVY